MVVRSLGSNHLLREISSNQPMVQVVVYDKDNCFTAKILAVYVRLYASEPPLSTLSCVMKHFAFIQHTKTLLLFLKPSSRLRHFLQEILYHVAFLPKIRWRLIFAPPPLSPPPPTPPTPTATSALNEASGQSCQLKSAAAAAAGSRLFVMRRHLQQKMSSTLKKIDGNVGQLSFTWLRHSSLTSFAKFRA